MNSLWKITLDDYFEVYKRAKAKGKKPGESMEEEFIEYMKEKNMKPIGNTELTKTELIQEHASHGKKILSVGTDKDGKQKIEIIKKSEELDK